MTTTSAKTTKLTDTQRKLLFAASQRPDHTLRPDETITTRAFARAVNALLKEGFVTAIERSEQDPEEPASTAAGPGYVITRAGFDAIGVRKPEPEPVIDERAGEGDRIVDLTPPSDEASPARPMTKRALIIAMLSTEQGAALEDLIAATGWLPHTTRAALTGLRQKGFPIERAKREDRTSFYRITGNAAHEQAA